MSEATLGPNDTAAELEGTGFVHLDGVLYAAYKTGDFDTAAVLVAQVAELADAQNHHPDIRLSYGSVEFDVSSHDSGGVTDRDIALARGIHEIADALRAESQPVQPTRH